MGSKGSELIIVRARRARSLALYGSKNSEFSIVWAQKAFEISIVCDPKARSLALYGLEKLEV